MPPILRHRTPTLFIDNTPLQEGAVADTYLTAEGTSAATTLTVKNILGLAINQILLIEDIGGENAEIVLTHASSAPTGTTVTLASALVKTHPVNSRVRVILFNQIELKRGTTNVAASASALTVATTTNTNPPSSLGSGLVAVDPTLRIQAVNTVEHTSGFYFARYYDSIHTAFSAYTDALAYGGWAKGTVGAMVDKSLRDNKLTLSDALTRQDCYDWITECLTEIDGKQLRWSEHYSFNTIIGQITSGVALLAMPTDAYDTESNKSILPNGLRLGDDSALDYLDPEEFDEKLGEQLSTTNRTQTSIGATSITLTNSYDFAASGSVVFWVSGVRYTATYTGVTRSDSAGGTGALTGVPATGTGSVSVIIPAGTYIYQNPKEGTPLYFTVRNSNIEITPIPDSTNNNVNAYLDYAKVVTAVDSDGDTIDFRRYDIVEPYLSFRLKMKAYNNGALDLNDGFYQKHKERLNDAIRTSPRNINFKSKPAGVNHMRRR